MTKKFFLIFLTLFVNLKFSLTLKRFALGIHRKAHPCKILKICI